MKHDERNLCIVELIRVNNDNTITVFSKFGSEVIENL